MEVLAMSSETWQEILGLLAVLPWIGFAVAVALFKLLELRDHARAARAAERGRSPRPESELSAGGA